MNGAANYQLAVAVYFSDGSVAFAPAVNINVTPFQFEVVGANNVSVAQGVYPELPSGAHTLASAVGGGQARHESNLESGLAVLGL
jgi:hypothetical protein